MAVYTDVSEEQVSSCLQYYAIGQLVQLKGIAQGVENSNFLLETTQGKFILTLYEKRIKHEELPWYLELMQYFARHQIACPLPVATKKGDFLITLKHRPAAIVTFLNGKELPEILPEHCFALGMAMAQMHQISQGFKPNKKNHVGPDAWNTLLEKSIHHGHDDLINEISPILQNVVHSWPSHHALLPVGQIHADLFPDNVFFQGNNLSGFIDFYFACTDFLAYDLAIALNAWCFKETGEYLEEQAKALLAGYQSVRSLTEKEKELFPLFKMGAALRFLLTRLHDLIYTPSTALVTPKDPNPYLYRLRYHLENKAKNHEFGS